VRRPVSVGLVTHVNVWPMPVEQMNVGDDQPVRRVDVAGRSRPLLVECRDETDALVTSGGEPSNLFDRVDERRCI
jgi:hypothetical protein